jgi:aryl-alcohol dehydrogenase (NADP+)
MTTQAGCCVGRARVLHGLSVQQEKTMETRKLGRSGLKVSPLCLGTMMFGGATDEAESVRIVDDARAIGCNFIDTADVYNDGASEEIVGRAIARDRNRWVLATKVCNPMSTEKSPNHRGLGRRWIVEACEASLRRLGTDHIDLYYMHKEDHTTPLEESVRAMGDLQRAGKIRYFAVSNHRSWRVAEICRIADGLGIDRPAARSSICRPAAISASAPSPTRRSPAASCPASTCRTSHRPRDRAPAARTRA